MVYIFLISGFMLFYIYLGYPAVVLLLRGLREIQVKKQSLSPPVTILISAYNEAEHIEATLLNKLSVGYPREKLEILVVSDGSTDGTDEIVKQYAESGVRLLRNEPRAGKTAALNRAVPEARGEIICFSDANSIWSPDAAEELVRNFADPSVGYVSGKMIYTKSDGTPIGDGCTAYMKYENFLREAETRIGSMVGVDGGVDAIRKSLYRPMNADQLPDFVLPLRVVEQGYRVVYEPGAVLREPALTTGESEYRMRVRVSLRALWAMYDMVHLLNFFRYGIFSWQMFSHKILRYLSFIFMSGLYLSSLYLSGNSNCMRVLFTVQSVFYLSAVTGYLMDRIGKPIRIFFIPYYFTLIHVASAHAFYNFVRGHKMVTWTPRKG